MSGGQQDRITILMGTYNGAAHLGAQLQSFAAQTDPGWRLICSDDGSRDASPGMIRAFAQEVPQQVDLRSGPRAGFSANYMSLIAGSEPDPGMLGFADQDDVWMADKLARARAALAGTGPRPALYCARRWLWDPEQDRRQASPAYGRRPSFRNALIENIAPGNTIVLNAAGAALARQAAQRTGVVFAHDWWLYLLIAGAGGEVIFDAGAPCLLYRQHDDNQIGGGAGAGAQIRRKAAVLRGAFRDRLGGNLAAMRAVEDLLTPENARLLQAFTAARGATLPRRIAGLWQAGPYRQSPLGSLGFWGAALLGRV